MRKKTFKLSGLQRVNKNWVIEGELEDGREVRVDINPSKQFVEVEFNSLKIADDKAPELIQEKVRRIIGRD